MEARLIDHLSYSFRETNLTKDVKRISHPYSGREEEVREKSRKMYMMGGFNSPEGGFFFGVWGIKSLNRAKVQLLNSRRF